VKQLITRSLLLSLELLGFWDNCTKSITLVFVGGKAIVK
jgi:hypothetical protein